MKINQKTQLELRLLIFKAKVHFFKSLNIFTCKLENGHLKYLQFRSEKKSVDGTRIRQIKLECNDATQFGRFCEFQRNCSVQNIFKIALYLRLENSSSKITGFVQLLTFEKSPFWLIFKMWYNLGLTFTIYEVIYVFFSYGELSWRGGILETSSNSVH